MRPDGGDPNLIGESSVFLAALRPIPKLAACDATVLVQGETGTGKELVARAIHYRSGRRRGPFVAINCGAIPESLVENQLFGHARGAFTDARESAAGLIAQSEGGTLFLDEVDAMPARAQVVLLRFLQDGEYRPVGSGSVRTGDVRVIAASNADLGDLVRRGSFRRDLHFRLNVLSLLLPPLRERGDDVVLLAEAFLRRFSHQYRKPVKPLHPESIGWLAGQPWSGNVRELENVIHRAVVLTEESTIRLGSTPEGHAAATGPSGLTEKRFREAKAFAIAHFESAYVAELLSRTNGNLSLAARLSGKERSRLGKLAKKYGLRRGGVLRRTQSA